MPRVIEFESLSGCNPIHKRSLVLAPNSCYPERMKESSGFFTTGSSAGFARVKSGWQSRLYPAMLFALLVGCEFAYSQSLDEIEKREQAVREAWEKTPLTVRRALFVSEEPQGFGVYTPRSSAQFKAGEQMIVYAEPVGYAWKNLEGGQYEFGVKIDLIVKTAAGKTVAEKENFGNLVLKSRAKNLEFIIRLDVNLSGVPPGDYLLDFPLHDAESDKTGMIELPFSLE